MVNDYFIRRIARVNANYLGALVALCVMLLGLAKTTAGFPAVHGATSDLSLLSRALDHFYSVHGRYATKDEGIAALTKQPPTVTDGRWEQLIRMVPRDPWGRDYVYVYPGVNHPDKYDLYSLGRDGISMTGGNDRDDVDPWNYKRAYSYYQLFETPPENVTLRVYDVGLRLFLAVIAGICVSIAVISGLRKLTSKRLSNEHPA